MFTLVTVPRVMQLVETFRVTVFILRRKYWANTFVVPTCRPTLHDYIPQAAQNYCYCKANRIIAKSACLTRYRVAARCFQGQAAGHFKKVGGPEARSLDTPDLEHWLNTGVWRTAAMTPPPPPLFQKRPASRPAIAALQCNASVLCPALPPSLHLKLHLRGELRLRLSPCCFKSYEALLTAARWLVFFLVFFYPPLHKAIAQWGTRAIRSGDMPIRLPDFINFSSSQRFALQSTSRRGTKKKIGHQSLITAWLRLLWCRCRGPVRGDCRAHQTEGQAVVRQMYVW